MRWFKQLFHSTPTIYHVSDNMGWSPQRVTNFIAEEVARHGFASSVIDLPWHLKNQLIHFHDRYPYLLNTKHQLHRSNRVFLTWLHGDPLEAEFASIGKRLLETLPRLEKIVTSCQTTEQQLMNAGVPREKLVLIPLGIVTELFSLPRPGVRTIIRQRLGIPENAFCIGSFQKDGNGWEEGNEPKLIKGPDILLQTVTRLAETHANLFVLLTGPARGYVKQGLEQLGIPYIHHYVEAYKDLSAYYHALDAYLITSRAEGGPMALMESWGAGVPVVSTRMGMPADWIRHSENGLLAEVEDAEGLVSQISRLIDDAALRTRLTQQARQDVQALDWRVLAPQYYEQLYRPYLETTTHA